MSRAEARIGVVVPGNIEIGRAVLRGVRSWCNAHPGTQLEVISTSITGEFAIGGDRKRRCIVAQSNESDVLAMLQEACPVVVATSNRYAEAPVPRVLNDDVEVGRMGARYLLGRGFHHLAYCSATESGSSVGEPYEYAFSHERREGFDEEAKKAGAAVSIFRFNKADQCAEVIEALNALNEPVGIMAASDLHARWFMEAFSDPQVAIPETFAVLGVDDDPLEGALCPVGLSSVRLSGERLGYEAAELGLRMACGEEPPERPIRIPPLSVVTRQSTSIFATDDPVVGRALRIMRDRMAELGDASDVVRASGVARRTLEWHFNRALKSTVARELTRARLRRARELLMTTNLSIKEIAYLVGFSEPRMLSLVFRRETGETPSSFRTRVRPGG